MTFFIDPDLVLRLAARFDRAAEELDGLSIDVGQAQALADLGSNTRPRLTLLGDEWSFASGALRAVVDQMDAAALDRESLAASLGYTSAELDDALDRIGLPADAPIDEVVAALIGDFIPPPSSLRQILPGLPPHGEDEEVDGAIARLDDALLESIVAGEGIDSDALSKQQRRDLEILARALGGDEITIRRTRTEIVRGGRGDDEYRTVTEDVPVTEAGPEILAVFLELNLEKGRAFREAAAEFNAQPKPTDDDIQLVADETGLLPETVRLVADNAGLISQGLLATSDVNVQAELDRLAEEIRELEDRQDGLEATGLAGTAVLALAASVLNPALAAISGFVGLALSMVGYGFNNDLETQIEQRRQEQRKLKDDGRDEVEDPDGPDAGQSDGNPEYGYSSPF